MLQDVNKIKLKEAVTVYLKTLRFKFLQKNINLVCENDLIPTEHIKNTFHKFSGHFRESTLLVAGQIWTWKSVAPDRNFNLMSRPTPEDIQNA